MTRVAATDPAAISDAAQDIIAFVRQRFCLDTDSLADLCDMTDESAAAWRKLAVDVAAYLAPESMPDAEPCADMTRQRAKALSRMLRVLATLLTRPGTLRAGDDVEKLCALALEAAPYLDRMAQAPLRTGGPE